MSDDQIKKECAFMTRQYRLSEARRYFDSKQYVQAHKIFEEVLTDPKESTPALLLACTAALYASKFPNAIKRANEVLKRNGKDTQAMTLKAVALHSLEHTDEAQKTIQAALQLKPDSEIILRYSKAICGTKTNTGPLGRRWRRASIAKPLTISDHITGSVGFFKTISLSAGGCLVEADILPDEFSFALELSPQRKIEGRAERRYRAGSKYFGIAFKNIDSRGLDEINQAILNSRGSS